LARAVGRSPNSLRKDISELQSKGICEVEAQANQHKLSKIELREPFRPPSSDVLSAPDRGSRVSVSSTDDSAFRHLVDFGIAPSVARELIGTVDNAAIVDTVEYVSHLATQPGNHIQHAQSLLVHYLRNDIRVPSGFVTKRQRREHEERESIAKEARQRTAELELGYAQWCDREIEQEIATRYTENELSEMLESIRKELISDPKIARLSINIQMRIARKQLEKKVRSDLSLPSCEDWCGDRATSQ
jgi:hypothetical protein